MRTRSYDTYRATGDEWLVRLPKHWELVPLRQVGKFLKGSGGSKEDAQATGGFPCIRYGDLYTAHRGFVREAVSYISPAKASQYTPLQTGDALFAASGETIEEIGKSAVNLLEHTAYCGGDVIVLRPQRPMVSGYLGYALDCRPVTIQKSLRGRGITVMHVYPSQLKSVVLPLPPIEEQDVIARFLEHATRRIDRYIRAKEKLIVVLGEQERALVHEAVTGQIDVRTGQPYPTYGASGIEWQDEVPGHWGMRRLGTVARVFNGSTPSRSEPAYWAGGTIPWLNSSKVNDGVVVEPSEYVTARALEECSIVEVPCGAVIVGLVGQGRTRGLAASLGIEATISQNLAAVVPTGPLGGRYLQYLLSAQYEHLRDLGRGGNQEALNCDLVGRLPVQMPSAAEQAAIVEHLDRSLTKVRAARTRVDRQIAVVKEYRTRLIEDVVTGKLDVRDAAVRLDERTTIGGIGARDGHEADPGPGAAKRGFAMEAES